MKSVCKDTVAGKNRCLLIVILGEQIIIFSPIHEDSTHCAT